jgi:hypothetical protein
VHNHGPFRPILAQDARGFERQFAGNGVSMLARCIDIDKLGPIFVWDVVVVAD